jgi:hypothetical protein
MFPSLRIAIATPGTSAAFINEVTFASISAQDGWPVVKIKVRKFGNSLGVVLPKEVLHRLRTGDGEPLCLIEAPEGGDRLTPYDPEFENEDGEGQ